MPTLISIDELKTYCGKSGNDADAWFGDEVVGAGQTLAAFLGYDPLESSRVAFFNGDGGFYWLVPARMVSAITLIEYRAELSVSDADWKTLPATVYQLQTLTRGTARILNTNCFTCGMQWRVTYVAGWNANVPEDLKTAAKIIGAIDYLNSFVSGGDRLIAWQSISKNFSQGASTTQAVKKIEDLEFQWQQRAFRYRLPVV